MMPASKRRHAGWRPYSPETEQERPGVGSQCPRDTYRVEYTAVSGAAAAAMASDAPLTRWAPPSPLGPPVLPRSSSPLAPLPLFPQSVQEP